MSFDIADFTPNYRKWNDDGHVNFNLRLLLYIEEENFIDCK